MTEKIESMVTITGAEYEALKALALRGAATQWRPIEEAPEDGTKVLVFARLNPPEKWHECVRDLPPLVCQAAYHPDAGWCVCEMREVVGFIPLSALGEPE